MFLFELRFVVNFLAKEVSWRKLMISFKPGFLAICKIEQQWKSTNPKHIRLSFFEMLDSGVVCRIHPKNQHSFLSFESIMYSFPMTFQCMRHKLENWRFLQHTKGASVCYRIFFRVNNKYLKRASSFSVEEGKLDPKEHFFEDPIVSAI